MARNSFEGIAMQSPAMHPVATIHDSYAQSEMLPLKIFLSTGSARDNEAQTRKLRDILEEKGYPMEYVEVPYGHSWDNWQTRDGFCEIEDGQMVGFKPAGN